MRRRFSIIVPALVLVAALFLGFSLLGRNTLRQGQSGTNQPARNFVGFNLPGTRPNIIPSPGPTNNGTGQQIKYEVVFDRVKANNIKNRLGTIDGVKQINTIVYGSTVLVGYTPSGKTINANTTKKMITDRVKQLDSTITNVIVSDSAVFSSKIRQLVNKINSGRPLDGLNTEYNRLVKNIMSGGM